MRHRNLQELTENDEITWTNLYEHYIKEINSDPVDLLRSPVNNKDNEVTDDEENLAELEDDQEDELRPDWMILAEISPNTNIQNSSDLEDHDMDKNYDWLNDGKQYYDNSDLMKANTFLERVSKDDQKNARIEENEDGIDIVNYVILNEK